MKIFTFLLVLLVPGMIHAQASPEEERVVEAAVREVRATFPIPEGTFTLDARFDGAGPLEVSNDLSPEFARRLGADRLAPLEEAKICPGNPSTCRLRHGVAAFAVSRPIITGNRASVLVSSAHRSKSVRTPIVSMTLRVDVEFKDGEWKVIEVTGLRIT